MREHLPAGVEVNTNLKKIYYSLNISKDMKRKTLLRLSIQRKKHFKDFFRIMKITFTLLFVCLFQLMAYTGNAQNTVISIKTNSMSVKELFNEIEKQTDYLLVFSNKEIDTNKEVSIKSHSAEIGTFLNEAFSGTDIEYLFENNYIVLKKKAETSHPIQQIAQQTSKQITGVVTDEKGEPIIGANIVEKGTTNGTITDLNGNFTLNISNSNFLVVSYIGYKEKEIPVNGQSIFNIKLIEDLQALDEVVVIGYGTARKSDLTGSLAQVTSESFAEQKVTRVDQALQGRASGVQISNTAGAPGGDVRIRIRGANSVLGDNSPLFVIDGFVGGDFNLLNPNDIKSIEVLKDASSTAIYGSRGANGVILITTKKGNSDGKINVNYSGDVSFSSSLKQYDMLSAGEFAETVNQHDKAMGIAKQTFSEEEIQEYYKTGGFDYLDAVFRNAISSQHQIAVSGGTEKNQFHVSGNYLDEQGIVKKSGYKRYSLRANLNSKVNNKFSFRFNLNVASSTGKNNHSRTGAGNPIVQAMAWAPTTNPYDADGGYTLSDPVGSIKTNPLAMIYDSEYIRERTLVNLMGGARYELIDGLALDFQAAADLGFYDTKSWNGEYASNKQPNASKTNSKSRTIQTTTQLSYNKTFDSIHRLNAVVALETQEYNWESLSGSASNLKFSELKYDNLAQAGTVSAGSDYSMWSLLSYLGRVNYSLMDKYLLSVSVRRDGSSKFAKENHFSTFPAAAVAWNMANEEFISNLNIFSRLKFRASWGLTGSQAISPYATLSAYNTSIYYAFNTNDRTNGIQIGNPGNSNLKWETTEQKDLGFEIGILNDRLSFEFDYFTKKTKDLLLNQSVAYYQGGGSITANVGDIENKGIELSLRGNIIASKYWSWDNNINFSSVSNKVTSLGKETEIYERIDIAGLNGQPEFVYKVGEPLGTFWGLKYLGPWKADQAEEAAKYGAIPGDARYEDLDNNYSIDGSDYQIIGCGMPKYTLGWNNTISFKKFTVNAFFQGVFGVDKLNYTRCLHMMASRDARQATLAEIKERYIPGEQEDAFLPAWSPTSNWVPSSTLFMEDASYLRLKNLSIAYAFNVKKVGDFKVSLNATNLFTITSYKGLDPESSNIGGGGSDISQGIDYGAYPNSRTYTIGLDITF